VPRPVFRGLRHYLSTLLFPLAPKNACSAETRFQGIATRSEQQARFCVRANLQCRDPFSGDCDQRWTPLLTGVREILLAVPRPVFRGLRLRGRGAQCAPRPSTCSAETRFQGIATLFLRHPQVPSHSIGLAVPRPVFRGLRPESPLGRSVSEDNFLQCRDPFSGDCDTSKMLSSPLIAWNFLQCRDPFSGDCDRNHLWGDPCRRITSCSAETRFQGIATEGRDGENQRFNNPSPCSAETRFQGIATTRQPCPESPKSTFSCSAETRFQGIATSPPRPRGPRSGA